MRNMVQSPSAMGSGESTPLADDLTPNTPTLASLPPELLSEIGAKVFHTHKESLAALDCTSHELRRDVESRSTEDGRPQHVAERAMRSMVSELPISSAEVDIPSFTSIDKLGGRHNDMFGNENDAHRTELRRQSRSTAKWKFVLHKLIREQRKPLSLQLVAAVEDLDEPRVASLIAAGADADYYQSEQISYFSGDRVTSPLSSLVNLMLTRGLAGGAPLAILQRLLEAGANIQRKINPGGESHSQVSEVLDGGAHVDLICCAVRVVEVDRTRGRVRPTTPQRAARPHPSARVQYVLPIA